MDAIQREIYLPQGMEQIDTTYVGAQSFRVQDLFKIDATNRISDSITAIGACTKILCILKSHIEDRMPCYSAFDKMMSNASLLKLPDKRLENDGRASMYNRLIAYLEQHKVGFRIFQKTEMDFFMTTIVATLWLLDGHWHKFCSASNVANLPKALHFVPPNQETYRVLSHGSQKKKVVPQIRSDDLILNHERLEQLTTMRFLQTDSWKDVLADILQLKTAISDYIRHLSRATDYKASTGVTNLQAQENRVLKLIPPCETRDALTVCRYKHLEDKLLMLPLYSELNIIFFAPSERRLKHQFIAGIQFSFPVQLYRSYKPNGTFIWRIPEEHDVTSSVTVISKIELNLEIRIKDDRIKRLNEVYDGTTNWTLNRIQEFASAITGR